MTKESQVGLSNFWWAVDTRIRTCLTCGNAYQPVSTRFHSLTQLTSTLAPVKVREVIQILEQDGWQQVVPRGSHRQFRRPTKPGRVTVAGKPSQELAPGTPGSVLRQSGLSKESR